MRTLRQPSERVPEIFLIHFSDSHAWNNRCKRRRRRTVMRSKARSRTRSMSDHCSFDLGSAAAMLAFIAVMFAVIIHLIPILLQMAWQVLPGILVLWLIVAVLRGMVNKLLV